MTETNDKFRSLFLAALMVTSVVAVGVSFTGAAAADTAGNETLLGASPNTLSDGQLNASDGAPEVQTQIITLDVAMNASETEQVEVDISEARDAGLEVDDLHPGAGANGVSVEDLSQDGDTVSFNLTSTADTTDTVALITDWNVSNAENDNRVNLVFSATNSSDVTQPFKVTGDFSTKVVNDDGTEEYDVFAGETLQLNSTTNLGTKTQVQIYEDDNGDYGSRVANLQISTYANRINYDTSNLDSGQTYHVRFGDEPVSAAENISVNDLGLSASADSTSITDADPVEVTAESNAPGEAYTATLLDSNGEEVASDSGNFDGAGVAEISFDSQSAGNYSVEVEHDDTGITATTDTIEVSQAGDASAAFGSDGFMTEDIGDVAEIPVELSNTDRATLVVGSESQNYIAHVHVEDGDGDDQVTVRFNTYAAGADQSSNYSIVEAAGDDDSATLEGQHGDFHEDYPDSGLPYSDHLETADYDLNVTADHVSLSETTDADAVGGLSLEERSTESIEIRTGPRGDDYSGLDAADVHARIGSNLTQTDEVASGDYAVHVIEASGIEGALEVGAARNDLSTTESLLWGADGQVSFTVKEANPGPNANPDPVNLYSGSPQLIPDVENDTYYFAIDTENLQYRASETNYTNVGPVSSGDELVANFTVRGNSGLSNYDRQTVETNYEVVERTASLNDGEEISVRAQSGQQISGETSVAPGTDVNVRIRSTDTDSPFQLTPSTEVTEDGTFTVTADFSDVNPGTNFSAVARITGLDDNPSVEGRVGEAAGASVSFSDQESDGSTVTVDAADLGAGGFIAIHQGDASGDVVGTSDYLGAGSQEDVEITLDEELDGSTTLVAMPHQDTNGNEAFDYNGSDTDAPYTQDGVPVTDSAEVTVGDSGTATPTETATPEETETATPTDTPTPTDDGGDETQTTTEGEGPGFTAVLALVALVAAALLAVRRDN